MRYGNVTEAKCTVAALAIKMNVLVVIMLMPVMATA